MPHKMDASAPIAALSQVNTRARPGQAALRDLSFSLHRGEILTLLAAEMGSAASGKSAILALLAGFARPASGEVTIGGRMMDATPTHRRHLGMVTRQLSLFDHLDVAGHASFAPGVTPAQADAILQRLDLRAFAHRHPYSLPPEIRLRVALARALAPAPALLLLEDPFSALPHAVSTRLKTTLRAIAAETGLAILHTADDAADSYGFSDRVGVLHVGRLLQIGTPQELYDHPESLMVAQAMGPLNKLSGTVLDVEDDIARIRLSDGAIVEGRMANTLEEGEACVVALRPERIAVAAMQVGEMSDGAVPARLLESVFAGDQMRLRFSLDLGHGGAPELLVTRPSGAVLPRGDTASLAWQTHHAHVFSTEAA